ncbi:MAG: hypothetical protein ACJASV_001780 [Pseudorhodobacter sp.]|jgi:uncharacterized protein YdcH (DUF465 family)
MSHTPHELAEEFPDAVEKMHQLKQNDAHFAKLFDTYHSVNRAVHRAETLVEPVAEARETELRLQRVQLKDAIWSILQAG